MPHQPGEADDPFINTVIGKLRVIFSQKRGGRRAYVCLCKCGNITSPMRAPYIVRRGALAACYDCSHGIRRAGLRSLRGERDEPTNREPEDDRCEQAGDPIWRERARALSEVILRPMTSPAVIVIARAHFGWRGEITREVLAAADGRELVKRLGLWNRPTRKWG
jgi:hypothetical protein